MCNLYRITTNQQAIRDIVGVMQDHPGNLEPVLGVYLLHLNGRRLALPRRRARLVLAAGRWLGDE